MAQPGDAPDPRTDAPPRSQCAPALFNLAGSRISQPGVETKNRQPAQKGGLSASKRSGGQKFALNSTPHSRGAVTRAPTVPSTVLP